MYGDDGTDGDDLDLDGVIDDHLEDYGDDEDEIPDSMAADPELRSLWDSLDEGGRAALARREREREAETSKVDRLAAAMREGLSSRNAEQQPPEAKPSTGPFEEWTDDDLETAYADYMARIQSLANLPDDEEGREAAVGQIRKLNPAMFAKLNRELMRRSATSAAKAVKDEVEAVTRQKEVRSQLAESVVEICGGDRTVLNPKSPVHKLAKMKIKLAAGKYPEGELGPAAYEMAFREAYREVGASARRRAPGDPARELAKQQDMQTKKQIAALRKKADRGDAHAASEAAMLELKRRLGGS